MEERGEEGMAYHTSKAIGNTVQIIGKRTIPTILPVGKEADKSLQSLVLFSGLGGVEGIRSGRWGGTLGSDPVGGEMKGEANAATGRSGLLWLLIGGDKGTGNPVGRPCGGDTTANTIKAKGQGRSHGCEREK